MLKCIWCMKETTTSPCEHCGTSPVYDPTVAHVPHWSRKTITEIECKICGRTAPYDAQLGEQICQATTNTKENS